jgi:hypothetical protein
VIVSTVGHDALISDFTPIMKVVMAIAATVEETAEAAAVTKEHQAAVGLMDEAP